MFCDHERFRAGVSEGRTIVARLSAIALFVAIPAASVATAKAKAKHSSTDPAQHLTRELKGSLATHPGAHLRLSTDLGTIHIHTTSKENVDYRVSLETDAATDGAVDLLKQFTLAAHETSDGATLRGDVSGKRCSGRLWVTFDVSVPRNYNLDVTTHGGNIETDDVDGRVTLITSGGNITAGSIGGSARLETQGGHITIKNVNGELDAHTGGGHISAGAITGSATLRTGGGHIRVTSIGGIARLDTGAGGNISVEKSGGELVAETRGGQIEIGEAGGQVHAKTGGGGIRVIRSSGPTNLESADGSIYLTQINGAVRASTNAGGITAWFGNDAKKPANCDLQSSDGDIIVYLPRQLPITIDAAIQLGDDHGLFVDPALPIKISYGEQPNGSHTVHAEGALNGGGEVLRLHTIAGNIRLMLGDANRQLQLSNQQLEQLQRKLSELQARLPGREVSDGPSSN